jgi:hypothetical protein
MPRDFFKHLAVFSILKQRETPHSELLPVMMPMAGFGMPGGMGGMGMYGMGGMGFGGGMPPAKKEPPVKVLEQGLVGSLDYKIIEASRADALYAWLKANKYSYSGDEATLNFYVQKKWVFTVMKIDTMQMKKSKDGSYAGEVTPTRFQFASEKLIYPLKITQISVKDNTEALFYVQAPHKVDLQDDMSYQYQWVPMLQAASGCTPGGLPGKGGDWLKAIEKHTPKLLERGQNLGFTFVSGQRPLPNKQGRVATTMEWAHRLTPASIEMLRGLAPYSERLPNVDAGFSAADMKHPQRAQAIANVIRARLAAAERHRPNGYLVRHAPVEDVRQLQQLTGHLQAGLFITKFRKLFTRDEMAEDLVIVPARVGDHQDSSEYEEILPTSPP